MLYPAVCISLVSALWYSISKAVVKNKKLGQLYVDTSVPIRHINTCLLMIQIPVQILYLSVLWTRFSHHNWNIYYNNFILLDTVILSTVIVQGITAVYLDQGLLYNLVTVIAIVLCISLNTFGKVHLFLIASLLTLTIAKFARSTSNPVPVTVTVGDVSDPIIIQSQQADYIPPPSIIPLHEDQTTRLSRPKYEGVQLKRPI
ncbi:solute carrier family 15 member [Acrasis kona]|uniref:Solute carrier family 15 member n=1 Tax=Acrasis kona TaxID=1008807 RepID=A0AAW2YTM6_9EUKA